jgi:hypothetical protein
MTYHHICLSTEVSYLFGVRLEVERAHGRVLSDVLVSANIGPAAGLRDGPAISQAPRGHGAPVFRIVSEQYRNTARLADLYLYSVARRSGPHGSGSHGRRRFILNVR